jgi:hypothetical protein
MPKDTKGTHVKTTVRADLWSAARARGMVEGLTVADVLDAALALYVAQPPPPPPAPSPPKAGRRA